MDDIIPLLSYAASSMVSYGNDIFFHFCAQMLLDAKKNPIYMFDLLFFEAQAHLKALDICIQIW